MNGKIVALATAAVIVVIIGGGIILKRQATAPAQPISSADKATQAVTNGDIKIVDTVVGTGTEATKGKKVTVQYTGKLEDGTKFDSSYDHGQPFTFTLGVGQVIKGWDQGVNGMKVGGKRTLTIPPELGYGAQSQSGIPANSTLIFDVELLDVQ
jgi:peptidylprolyl isomerase